MLHKHYNLVSRISALRQMCHILMVILLSERNLPEKMKGKVIEVTDEHLNSAYVTYQVHYHSHSKGRSMNFYRKHIWIELLQLGGEKSQDHYKVFETQSKTIDHLTIS